MVVTRPTPLQAITGWHLQLLNAKRYCVVEAGGGNLKLHYRVTEQQFCCMGKKKKKSGSAENFVGKPVLHDGMKFDALPSGRGFY